MNKIVIICPYLFRLTRGIERFCISLSKAFADKGYKVIMYTWSTNKEISCGEIDSRIKIRKVPFSRWWQEKIAVLFYRLWLLLDNPKITILNFLYHGEVRLPKNKKYLYILHSPASQIPNRYEFIKDSISAFDKIHIVAISKLVEEEARPYIGDTPMSLIYNGTDIQIFKPKEKKQYGSKLKIITAAAFEERKGMHYMIKALSNYRYRDQIEYDIYGSGDKNYETYLLDLIENNKLSNCVSLKGGVNNISDLLPQYDLFVLLSKGEAFALSPLEAMACGVPILVSDYPPYPEFVSSTFGKMVNRDNVTEIQSFLTEIIENKEKLNKMREVAILESKKFSWDNIVDQYIKLINY